MKWLGPIETAGSSSSLVRPLHDVRDPEKVGVSMFEVRREHLRHGELVGPE